MIKLTQKKETMKKYKIIKVEDRKCDECNIDDMMESFNFED